MPAPAPATRLFPEIQLEYICSYWATLTPPEVIGPTPEGLRAHVYVKAGEISGPRLRGRFRPVGGDWLLIRPDGVGILDVRATLELEDGALVYTTYGGTAELGPDGYNQFLQGKPPARVDLKIVPVYHTSHAGYLWLNRLQCVGVGVADLEQLRVSYDIYSIR
jgi:hypothetical protein